jgi:hypothetical protein
LEYAKSKKIGLVRFFPEELASLAWYTKVSQLANPDSNPMFKLTNEHFEDILCDGTGAYDKLITLAGGRLFFGLAPGGSADRTGMLGIYLAVEIVASLIERNLVRKRRRAILGAVTCFSTASTVLGLVAVSKAGWTPWSVGSRGSAITMACGALFFSLGIWLTSVSRRYQPKKVTRTANAPDQSGDQSKPVESKPLR